MDVTDRPRVLLVDDSETFQRLVRASLEPEGFEVDGAPNADRGLDMARKTRYHAILVDFVLPDADGLVLVEQLARWGVDAPVIALSGSESPEVATRFLRAGVVEFLRKDLASPARILHCVRQAARVHDAHAKVIADAKKDRSSSARARSSPDEVVFSGPDADEPAGRRVLVIDDTEDSRYLLRRTLERRGWIVDEASSGKEAMERSSANPPDVVLLDYLLPDTQGIALLQKLRAAGVSAPIIALTGHGSETVAQEFVMAGATDFLSKDDLTEARLVLTLRNALWMKP